MAFQFIKTSIKDLMIIEPHQAPDERGLYKKCYEKNIYEENGIVDVFNENSFIYSHKGAVRGLHYQTVDSQAKLIQVVKGSIYDVAVDLRTDSETFGKCFEIRLDADEHKTVYIPAGFAHGFQALEDDTIFSYLCSGKYVPEACGGILWNDKILNIDWPIKDESQVILSQKDKFAQSFEEYCSKNK